MALAQKSAMQASRAAIGSRVSVPLRAKATRSVRVHAAADRPLWFPGNPVPSYLDGTLAGDTGFDPLGLSSSPEMLKWNTHAELIHCRWAMLGAAGVLFTSIGNAAGLGFPEWFDAGKVSIENGAIGFPAVKASFGTLLAVQFLLFNWAEVKRWYDIKNPGSQGDGSFFGITDDFKGVENGYPGGKYFDPFGLSRGDPALYKKYKENEVRNGRLAMVANLGFWAQYLATGKGPITNLLDHVADPQHVTFATNGVSVPFL